MEREVRLSPILLYLNYWEFHSSQVSLKLDELVKEGFQEVLIFIPWQAIESDISQRLLQFLQAAEDQHVWVHLVMTPELGIHYPFSGLPKDLLTLPQVHALDQHSRKITVLLPPGIFYLPSYFSPMLQNRYQGFLAKMNRFFLELSQNQFRRFEKLSLLLTGSFWKYYHTFSQRHHGKYQSVTGDYSTFANQNYQQMTEAYYSQPEFLELSSAAVGWKSRLLEPMNRKRFYHIEEALFRKKNHYLIKKGIPELKTFDIELFTPEADPLYNELHFFRVLTNEPLDISVLSHFIEESVARQSMGCEGKTFPLMHWTSIGGFNQLLETEKQFLFLKSFLFFASQKGGILIDERDWKDFSPNFKKRMHALMHSFNKKSLKLKTHIFYLVSHIWSLELIEWEVLQKIGSPHVHVVSSFNLIFEQPEVSLLMIESSYIFTKQLLSQCIHWVTLGKIAALPKNDLYTRGALDELEKVIEGSQKIEMNVGFPFEIYLVGEGKLILFKVPQKQLGEPLKLAWKEFLTSFLALGEVQKIYQVSDDRLTLLPLEYKKDEFALFIFNESENWISAHLAFSIPVKLGDLAAFLSDEASLEEEKFEFSQAPENRFQLEVPSRGILSLKVKHFHNIKALSSQGLNAMQFQPQ